MALLIKLLSTWRSRLAGGHHDLVLLDLGMPDMDGFRVLKAMRNHDPAQRPTVIIVTSDKDEDSILRGFGLGAADYVTKPFNPRELIARCDRAIRNVAKLRDSVVITTLDGLASGPILGGGASMFRSA
jgi:DNA-binding response OmpR family regulator